MTTSPKEAEAILALQNGTTLSNKAVPLYEAGSLNA